MTSLGESWLGVPELPEVETIARELDERLPGKRIATTRVIRPDVLRVVGADDLVERLRGREVLRVWRRAKSVVIDLSGAQFLIVQPRFTGAILVRDQDGLVLEDDPHATVVWELEGDGSFFYRDVRRLGTVHLVDEEGLREFDARLGPEPLDPAFTHTRLSGILRASRSAIKKVLMDQRCVAGVGNIYANEALWRSGLDPSRPALSLEPDEVGRLHDELVDVLEASIEARGTTFRDYRDPSNRSGSFAAQLMAYGRGGLQCRRCATRLVETHTIDGRSTVFCYRCQR